MHIRYPAQAKRANKSAYLRSFDVSQYNVETRPASINCEYTNRGLFLFLILTCMFLIAKNVPVPAVHYVTGWADSHFSSLVLLDSSSNSAYS